MFVVGFLMFFFAMFVGPFIMLDDWFDKGSVYIVHIKLTIAWVIDLAIGLSGIMLCQP